MSSIEVNEVLNLRNLTMDDLALLLSDRSAGYAFGSSPATDEQKKHIGIAMFNDVCCQLSAHLSANKEKALALIELLEKDETKLITSLFDLVASINGGIPIAVITAMILKYGVSKICGS